MHFGLKNEGVTYKTLVKKMFIHQLRKTMEVYIDNIVVKSKKVAEHLLLDLYAQESLVSDIANNIWFYRVSPLSNWQILYVYY